MTKLHNPTLFSDTEFRSFRFNQFEETELGQLYASFPFEELSKLLPQRSSSVGAPSWFKYQGYFGLMILKSYLNLSDAMLINRINTDWALQMFCGIQLKETEQIKDKDIPSRIRTFLGDNLDIESFQRVMIKYWKPYMQDTHCFLNDATAYESYIKYPTDVKLLWDSSVWVFETMFKYCKHLKIRRPRSKYRNHQIMQLNYQKTKRKGYKLTRKRKRLLLQLLNKGLGQLKDITGQYQDQISNQMNDKFQKRLRTIYIIQQQQQYMYDNPGQSVQDRIVSLFKPYLRPIVRGKEIKRVEFGAKVMTSQVDGINLIDKLSFDPFNESVYLQQSIINHKVRFGKCSQVGVDQIYGSNANRKYMTQNNIYNCLVRKGKPSKYEDQARELRKQLGKERSTVLEGSFGNEKNHYGLKIIKARLKETEKIWILFGITTANAMKIAKRKKDKVPDQFVA